jgi:hypothetical protein
MTESVIVPRADFTRVGINVATSGSVVVDGAVGAAAVVRLHVGAVFR